MIFHEVMCLRSQNGGRLLEYFESSYSSPLLCYPFIMFSGTRSAGWAFVMNFLSYVFLSSFHDLVVPLMPELGVFPLSKVVLHLSP